MENNPPCSNEQIFHTMVDFFVVSYTGIKKLSADGNDRRRKLTINIQNRTPELKVRSLLYRRRSLMAI